MKNKLNLVLLITAGGVFAWSLFGLFALRFERGDTYAPYSSFRADPKGCKVLYESLDNLAGVEAERLLRPIAEIEDVDKTVMLITNVSDIDDLSDIKGLNSYLQCGGNILIFCAQVQRPTIKTLKTANHAWSRKFLLKKVKEQAKKVEEQAKKGKEQAKKVEEEDKKGKEEDKKVEEDKPTVKNDKSACEIKDNDDKTLYYPQILNTISLEKRQHPHRMPILAQPDEQLKPLALPEIDIYSHGYLKFTDDRWQNLYSARKQIIMIKGEYGRGTVIVSAASYFISNEAMLKNPPVKLLTWLIGDRRRVIFNELVHGNSNQHNIAWLVGKYRLPVLLFNLLLVMMLFVWRSFYSSVNFQQEQYKSSKAELSSTSGLAKLLRKNISPSNLLSTSLTEWRKDRIVAIGKHTDAELLAATDPKGRQLKVDYNNIVSLINKRKHHD